MKDSRRSTHPAPVTLKQPKINDAVRSMRPGKSLRPDTEQLALALLNGDEVAAAVIDSYRLHTSRATRLLVLSADDPIFSRVTTFEKCGGGNDGGKDEPSHRPAQPKGPAIKACLDEAITRYQAGTEDALEGLWLAIELAARQHMQGFKQANLRNTDRAVLAEDIAQSLTIHCVEQVKAGKFDPLRGSFKGWLSTVFHNFTRNELNKLSREQSKFIRIATRKEEEDVPESGFIFEDTLPVPMDDAQDVCIADALASLSEADWAYAGVLKQGLSQKEAAESMGESTKTSRKREARIRAALQQQGFGQPSEAVQA